MLSNEQLKEIKSHVDRAQNPVFFFDNDLDGLMSFVLLRRYIGSGKGVAVKSFPDLDASYIRKIDEFNPDYVFILDKPLVSEEFFEEVRKRNLPVVWIDHHDVGKKINKENVFHFNPIFSENSSNEPTSYLVYKTLNSKKDMWLAMAGCLSDNFLPEFSEEFTKLYPGMWKKNAQSAFEVLYEGEFGKLITILDFSLKDRTSKVVGMMNFLLKVQNPSDILVENNENKYILERYNQVNAIYLRLLENAKAIARTSGKLVVFKYGGKLSLSADIANEISYRFPGKVVLVAYTNDYFVNVSIRGNLDVRDITLRAIAELSNATGGGHKNATGAKMSLNDFSKFVSFFEKEVEDQ